MFLHVQGCSCEGAAVANEVAQRIPLSVLCRDNCSVPQHHVIHLLRAQPCPQTALPAPHALWPPSR